MLHQPTQVVEPLFDQVHEKALCGDLDSTYALNYHSNYHQNP